MKRKHNLSDVGFLLNVQNIFYNLVLCSSHKSMPDLPIEILRQIFAYSSSSLRVRRAHEFPWYLGQVCSRWRALFFSMRSTFWKRIEINWDNDFPRRTRFAESVKAILAFFLNRTQGAPFSFSLFRKGDHPNMTHVQWIIKDLLPFKSVGRGIYSDEPGSFPLGSPPQRKRSSSDIKKAGDNIIRLLWA